MLCLILIPGTGPAALLQATTLQQAAKRTLQIQERIAKGVYRRSDK
jgi:hypothetical protein